MCPIQILSVCLPACLPLSRAISLSLSPRRSFRALISSLTVLLAVCGIKSSYGDEDILLTIAKVGDRAVLPCVNNADNQVRLIRN